MLLRMPAEPDPKERRRQQYRESKRRRREGLVRIDYAVDAETGDAIRKIAAAKHMPMVDLVHLAVQQLIRRNSHLLTDSGDDNST